MSCGYRDSNFLCGILRLPHADASTRKPTMSEETEHTPLPWVADSDDRPGMAWNIHILSASDRDMRICFMTSAGPAQQNADLIVRSVNAVPDLVKALEEIVASLTSMEAREIARAALANYRRKA
jgi:hypothetical protein